MIRRRQVIYVEGYDPQGASGYYGLFRAAMRRFLKAWPIKSDLGELKLESDAFACWTIGLSGPNWHVDTRYTFLRQEHIISANIAEPMVWQACRSLAWLADSVLSGAMFRIFCASWRFGAHLVWFQLMLLAWIAAAVGAGWLVALAAFHWGGLPTLWSAGLGIVVGVAAFPALGKLFDRWHVTQIINHWPLLRRFGRGNATCLDQPIEDGAQRLVMLARANDADEIVVVGHSGGGVLGPAVMARALALDPDVGRHGPAVVLMTLGSIMPGVALHSSATAIRDMVRRLAVERSIVWIDCQSRKDVMNFWNFDPVEGVGVEAGPQRCNPLVWLVRFKDMVSPEFYRRLRRSFFRLHYQFIMSGDRRAAYDYVMLTCGPLPVAQWAKHPGETLALFAADGSLTGPGTSASRPALAS
ncbi:MAG: hypothetical protein GEU91_00130 [Rhizobiales bacterium]|nr:hypothetical protein [Hyphomicrobiales bacterium]